jgi:hypothetical protein
MTPRHRDARDARLVSERAALGFARHRACVRLPDATGDIEVDLKRDWFLDATRRLAELKAAEGFSSGEQAFAFTQAQLALRDHRLSRRPHRGM